MERDRSRRRHSQERTEMGLKQVENEMRVEVALSQRTDELSIAKLTFDFICF